MLPVRVLEKYVIILNCRKLEVWVDVEDDCSAWGMVATFQCCLAAPFALVAHRRLPASAAAVVGHCQICKVAPAVLGRHCIVAGGSSRAYDIALPPDTCQDTIVTYLFLLRA